MSLNITYKLIDNYFKTNKSNTYEYEDSSGYRISVIRQEVKKNVWLYSCTLSYRTHVVWSCGNYKTTSELLADVTAHALPAFLNHISGD